MVVCRLFGHFTGQLRYFDLIRLVEFQTGVDDFPLAGFESVDARGDASLVGVVGKQDQFFVDEFILGNGSAGGVDEGVGVV